MITHKWPLYALTVPSEDDIRLVASFMYLLFWLMNVRSPPDEMNSARELVDHTDA
ncbi:MAG: hypothetical protein H6Q81_182 [Deltaproteobacteria bacterium]|nr:hypothetical protein [Deltaproteobacteria bacterium]